MHCKYVCRSFSQKNYTHFKHPTSQLTYLFFSLPASPTSYVRTYRHGRPSCAACASHTPPSLPSPSATKSPLHRYCYGGPFRRCVSLLIIFIVHTNLSMCHTRFHASQQGYAAIPKSTRQNRIVENTDIFGWALNEDDMKEMDVLDECKFNVISSRDIYSPGGVFVVLCSCYISSWILLALLTTPSFAYSPHYRLGSYE